MSGPKLGTDEELASVIGGPGLALLDSDLTCPAPHYVYRITAWTGLLLYVGCTNDVRRRLMEHRARSSWYPLAQACRATRHDGPADAHRAERQAIRNEHPMFNRVEYVERTRYEAELLEREATAENEIVWGLDFLFGQMFDEDAIKAEVERRHG